MDVVFYRACVWLAPSIIFKQLRYTHVAIAMAMRSYIATVHVRN